MCQALRFRRTPRWAFQRMGGRSSCCGGRRIHMIRKRTPIYGLLAEFDGPQQLIAAVRATRAGGYRRIDAYTPFPVEGLEEEVGFHHTKLPLVVLIGGIVGCLVGFGMQYY